MSKVRQIIAESSAYFKVKFSIVRFVSIYNLAQTEVSLKDI